METIRSSAQISSIFESGKRSSNRYLTLIFSPSAETAGEHGRKGRVAFIAGKKSGNAVWRNSAKRRLREICRALNGPWEDFDVLFVAKKALTQDSYSKVLTACKDSVKRAGFEEGLAGEQN